MLKTPDFIRFYRIVGLRRNRMKNIEKARKSGVSRTFNYQSNYRI